MERRGDSVSGNGDVAQTNLDAAIGRGEVDHRALVGESHAEEAAFNGPTLGNFGGEGFFVRVLECCPCGRCGRRARGLGKRRFRGGPAGDVGECGGKQHADGEHDQGKAAVIGHVAFSCGGFSWFENWSRAGRGNTHWIAQRRGAGQRFCRCGRIPVTAWIRALAAGYRGRCQRNRGNGHAAGPRKVTKMPVRKRGASWQVDLRLTDGTRIRRNYPTQEEATTAEAALRPNPQARAAARKLRRRQKQSARPRATARKSNSPSSSTPGTCPPAQSNLITLPASAPSGEATSHRRGDPPTANSGDCSEPSAHPPGAPLESRPSPPSGPKNESCLTSILSRHIAQRGPQSS